MTSAEFVNNALMDHGGQYSRYYKYNVLSHIADLTGNGVLWLTGLPTMSALRKAQETAKCTFVVSFTASDGDEDEQWDTLPGVRHVIIRDLLDDESPDTRQKMHHCLIDLAPRIHRAMLAGESVLVHCRGGVSRSATLVLYYMIWYDKQANNRLSTLLEYVQRLKDQRECIAPNLAFLELLEEYLGHDQLMAQTVS